MLPPFLPPPYRLPQLREQRAAIEEMVDAVVEGYHAGFNKSIHNYSLILRLFTESRLQVGGRASTVVLDGHAPYWWWLRAQQEVLALASGITLSRNRICVWQSARTSLDRNPSTAAGVAAALAGGGQAAAERTVAAHGAHAEGR